jgi:uncharacterized membrane protein
VEEIKGVNYMNERSLGMLAGVFTGVVAVAIYFTVRRRMGKKNDEYDERQMVLRGRAFQKAFFVLIFYLFANSILCAAVGEWAQNGVDGLLGVFVAIGYFIVSCIHTNAYLALQQKPQYYQRLFAIVCVVGAFSGYANWKDEGFLTDGLVNTNAIIPACGVVFLVALIALTVHTHRREDDGEDE